MYKGLLTATILTLGSTAFAGPQTICGPDDDRALSYESKVGRLAVQGEHKGCTLTMISESCGISAGHCLPVLEKAEFNTPISIDDEPQASDAKDVYLIDKDSIVHEHAGPGKDWAVFNVKPNAITGNLPGSVQGFHTVSFDTPSKGALLSITGYGRDNDDADKNFAQQSHMGNLESVGGTWRGPAVLQHTVDTMGGNSGSSIIDETSGQIVGVHTHGGCRSTGGANMGTLISAHEEFKAAIRACLNRE